MSRMRSSAARHRREALLPALEGHQHAERLEVGLELEGAHERVLRLVGPLELLVVHPGDLAQDLLALLEAAGGLQLLLQRDDVVVVPAAAGEHRRQALERRLVGRVELEDLPQRLLGRLRVVEASVLHPGQGEVQRSARGPAGTFSATSS